VVSSLGGRKSVQSTKLAITAIPGIVCPEMQLREENHCLRFNTVGREEGTSGEKESRGAFMKAAERLRAII